MIKLGAARAYNSGAMTRATTDISLSRMFSEGPEVSFIIRKSKLADFLTKQLQPNNTIRKTK